MSLLFISIFLGVVTILLTILLVKYLRAMSSLNEFIQMIELQERKFENYVFPNKDAEEVGDKIIQLIKKLENSERKHEAVKARNKQLKREMTTNIAHELKTPVSSILGYLEILKNQPNLQREKAEYFIQRAHFQSIRLSHLINDITLLTKLEEAPATFITEEVCIHQCFEDAIHDLHIPEEKEINVNNMVLDNSKIYGNYNLIYSIFRNLIENSVKYAGDKISINLEIIEEKLEEVILTYYDTGQGIPTKHLDVVFDRFMRLDEGRSRKTGGSGLGLSIVKHAVQFHGGKIKAMIHPSGGLQFQFSLKRNLKIES